MRRVGIGIFFLILIACSVSKSGFAQIFRLDSFLNTYQNQLLQHNSIWFDADQDCDLDLLNVSIYNERNKLYIDSTSEFKLINSVLNADGGNANGACVGDIDNDGDLDVLVYSIFGQKNFLYRQIQKGVFEKEYANEELQMENNAFYAEFCDIDMDQDLDVLITDTELWNPKQVRKQSRLFINNGAGQFSRHKDLNFGNAQSNTRYLLLFDFDNDLLKDVLILNFGSSAKLMRNKGDLKFEEVVCNLSTRTLDAMDALAVDFDRDGDQDVVIATARNGLYYYRNDGNNLFTELDVFNTHDFGIIDNISSIDYNSDDWMDILVHSKSNNTSYVLLNETSEKFNYVKFKLRASKSNYFAIGTKIFIKHGGKWQYQELIKQNSIVQKNTYDVFFGLKNDALIDSIKIIWPDGMIQYLRNLIANNAYLIHQQQAAKIIKEERSYVFKEEGVNDLSISMVAGAEMKIGENNSLSIFFKNNSAVHQDIYIDLELSENFKLQYAYPVPSETEERAMHWKIRDLRPMETGIITLNFSLPISADLLYKDLILKARIRNGLLDEFPLDNEVELSRIIK